MSRILYVEDNCLLQLDGAEALAEAGYEVSLADDGAAACHLMGHHAARYDALITDIDLPGDIQGWRIATDIRKHNSGLPVIYVTGHAAHDFRAMGVANSIMIEKPFQWPGLLEIAVGTAQGN